MAMAPYPSIRARALIPSRTSSANLLSKLQHKPETCLKEDLSQLSGGLSYDTFGVVHEEEQDRRGLDIF